MKCKRSEQPFADDNSHTPSRLELEQQARLICVYIPTACVCVCVYCPLSNRPRLDRVSSEKGQKVNLAMSIRHAPCVCCCSIVKSMSIYLIQ